MMMPLLTAALLVTSTMGAEERGRAGMPLMNVVLMESLMRVITSVHATAWHMVLMATTASTPLSFHAAILRVNVWEV